MNLVFFRWLTWGSRVKVDGQGSPDRLGMGGRSRQDWWKDKGCHGEGKPVGGVSAVEMGALSG